MNCGYLFDNIIGHNDALNELVISENENNENIVTNAVARDGPCLSLNAVLMFRVWFHRFQT